MKEVSQTQTVAEGEQREEILSNVWRDYLVEVRGRGFRHQARDEADDIDREMFRYNELHHYFEIKERTCSLNAFQFTKFPFAKIDKARLLHKEHNVPVLFILKFIDAWSYLSFDPGTSYRRGKTPFAPNYRPSQSNSQKQIPVEIPVETLKILPLPPGV